jgi:hypothetical protein
MRSGSVRASGEQRIIVWFRRAVSIWRSIPKGSHNNVSLSLCRIFYYAMAIACALADFDLVCTLPVFT